MSEPTTPIYAMTLESRERIARLLEDLADGEAIALEEFGDNAASTPADEDASNLRELAQSLRKGS